MAGKKTVAARPAKYEAEEEEPKEKEEAPAQEETPAEGDDSGDGEQPAEGPPVDAGEMPPEGDPAGDPNAQMGGEEMPPPDHDSFLANLNYAISHGTSPELYGMFAHYAETMQQQMAEQEAQQGAQGEMPAEGAVDPAGDPAGDPGAEAAPEGDPAADPQAEAEAQHMLEGGAQEMPEPGQEEKPAGYDFSVDNLVPGGSTLKKGAKTALGGAAGGAAGLGVGMLTGNPLAGAGIGAGLGGGAALMSQNNESPQTYAGTPGDEAMNEVLVQYQEAINNLTTEVAGMKRQFASEIKAVKAESAAAKSQLAAVAQREAAKDVQLILYQFDEAGVVATSVKNPEKREAVKKHLLALPADQRRLKANEILSEWAKDESMAYQNHSINDEFLEVYQGPAATGTGTNKEGLLDKDGFAKVTAFLRTDHGKRLQREGKSFDEIKQYALTGGESVVNYQANGKAH